MEKKKDRLERFVQEHRDEFDCFEPRPDLWQDITQQLSPEKTVQPFWFRNTIRRYAAAVLIVLGAGWSIYHLGRYTQRADIASVQQTISIAEISPELAKVEAYYTSLINQKKLQLNDADLKALGLEGNFDYDLMVLDSAYTKLRKDLYTEMNKEKIVNAMIQNLQLRTEIINQQIQTLRKIKLFKESTQHENINI
jgi:hypothetical protein